MQKQHYVKYVLRGETLEINTCKNHLNTVYDLKRYVLGNIFDNKGLNQNIVPWIPHLTILKRSKIDLLDEFRLDHPDFPTVYFSTSKELKAKLFPINPNETKPIRDEPYRLGDLRTDANARALILKSINHFNDNPQLVATFLSQIPQSQIRFDHRRKEDIMNDLEKGKNILQNIYQDYSQPELSKFSQQVHDLVHRGYHDLHLNRQALQFVGRYTNERKQIAIRLLQGAYDMKSKGYHFPYLNLRALGYTMGQYGQLKYQLSYQLLDKIEYYGKDKLQLKYELINCSQFRKSQNHEFLQKKVLEFSQKLALF